MGLLSRASAGQENTESDYKAAMELFIEDYAKKHGAFHCIVFNCDMHELYGMISHFCSIMELDKGNCLILVPKNIDRQLLAHRLSETLKITVLYQSASDNAVEALISLSAFFK